MKITTDTADLIGAPRTITARGMSMLVGIFND